MTCPLADFIANAGPDELAPSGMDVDGILSAIASDIAKAVRTYPHPTIEKDAA